MNCCARCFLPALRRLCINSSSYEYKNKSTSNGAQLVCRLFAEISVRRIPASLWHLHLSIFVVHQSDPERSVCLRSQWQHTESDVYHFLWKKHWLIMVDKPQPFPDTKRKRKPTNPNKHKSNNRTKSTKISSLFPKRGNRNAKRTEKHKNKMTQGKT